MKKLNLVGCTFGRLTVVSSAMPINNKTRWNCLCSCGEEITTITGYLRSGDTKSCGCLVKDGSARLSHGHNRVNKRTRTYRIWAGMKARCTLKTRHEYRWYGAKGIAVCAEWQNFQGFLSDMGAAPENMAIDRIDSDKGYFKENCRWITHAENASRAAKKRWATDL